MRICQPNSRASFYHFKKLFIVCLSQCVSCLDILLTETDEFESNLFINLLYNVVNPPVQDCIISALIKLQDLQNDSLNAKLIDCQFAERLCEMILSNDVQVCSGAVVLFQRILINSRHDSNFFLDGLRGDSTSIQAIFMKCSDPAVPIAFKEQYISLFHSLVTCKLESVLDFAKSCLDSFQLLFPTIFIRTKFLEYSVSTQIKLLQVLVFYTRLDSRVLEFIDWDFFISGFFDRYKYSVLIRDCSMYLVYCYQLIAIAFEVAHQKSFEQFIELYLADDLISNMESRFGIF
jgi:hypothetical protein